MEKYAILISGLSLIVSVISLIFSILSKRKASALARENTKLANGMLELEVRSSISDSTFRVNEVAMKMNSLIAKRKANEISEVESIELEALKNNWRSAVQGMLNAYDEACTKYIDGKVDKERFKKNYHVEIRNLLESAALKEFFDPHTSRYKAILKVYNEWENLEQ